jgi:uncharacterized membrane protein YkvA (DUF1232 family)
MFKLPLELVYSTYRKLVANPKYRWWVIAGTLAYLVSPFDISPDVIPLIGEIDDAIVVTMLATELIGVLRDRSLLAKQKPLVEVVADGAIIDAKVVEVM